MKYAIYILVILILSSNCFGQKDTMPMHLICDGTTISTVYKDSLITICEYDGSALTEAYLKFGVPFPEAEHICSDTLPPTDTLGTDLHFDTVKVMMFYADTTERSYYFYKDISDNAYRKITQHNETVYWQYGYRVQKLHDKWPETYFPYKETIGYLDIDKHLLSKNIVVWKTIEVK